MSAPLPDEKPRHVEHGHKPGTPKPAAVAPATQEHGHKPGTPFPETTKETASVAIANRD